MRRPPAIGSNSWSATSCARRLALARLTESSGGQLLYQFRRLWSDGSTALLLDPLELLERLAALVPTTPSNYTW